MQTRTGEHIYRLPARERINQLAFGAFIFGLVPALLGAMLIATLYASGHRGPAVPGPAPVTVVPAPLQTPRPVPSPVVVVSA